MQDKDEEDNKFADSPFEWRYKNNRMQESKVTTYKVDSEALKNRK